MLQLGMNLTAVPPDALRKIHTEDLYRYIKEGALDLKSRIDQLQRIRQIDEKKYHQQKVQLPYFTCGIFHPPNRKTENFAFIEHFVVDIDHLSSKELTPEGLKDRLAADNRVVMAFISPGGDGLKLLFSLKEKITDPVRYTMFYKLFVHKYSIDHGLVQVIDKKTCDVARATFLSFDPDVYRNPFAEPVDSSVFIDFESAASLEAAGDVIKEIDGVAKEAKGLQSEDQHGLNPLTSELLTEIKKKLNPNIRLRKEKKEPVVPEKLVVLEKKIREKAIAYGLEVVSTVNIQYGKQMTFRVKELMGELNIFYGKKGFSVIKSSKTGTSEEVNDIAYKIVCELIF
ncbi:MAG: hypothetical protein FJY10_11790 [Bacteroidetes bacterium]|nr:hypothetical protein [Bacteroidota bacterium]